MNRPAGASRRTLCLTPGVDISEIYAAQVEALADLVLRAGDQVDAPVPACPDWRVRDVVAHMAELARDRGHGESAGHGPDGAVAGRRVVGPATP